MDWHVEQAEELFSAARAEFKHLEHFYFHNCLYERRVEGEPPPLATRRRRRCDVIRTYPSDYRVVFVGDASMSPYEIVMPGGSVEHWNEEAGPGLGRAAARPLPQGGVAQPRAAEALGLHRSRSASLRRLFGERMFPLTIEGIDGAMRELVR